MFVQLNISQNMVPVLKEMQRYRGIQKREFSQRGLKGGSFKANFWGEIVAFNSK